MRSAVAPKLHHPVALTTDERARRLEEAEELAQCGTWQWCLATNEMWFSDQMFRTFGFEPGAFEPTFETILTYVHPDERARVSATVESVIAAAEPAVVDARIVAPSGASRMITTRIAVKKDEHGTATHLLGIAQDVTERAEILQALRRSEERFRAVARATEDVVWDFELGSDVVTWGNDTIFMAFGHDTAPVPLSGWLTLIHPDDVERVGKSLHDVIDAGGTSWSDEYRFRRADGTYADIFDRGFILRDLQGRPLRVIGAMQDITSRKDAERRQAALVAELEEVNRELGEFAYVVSHDLKAPLRGIGSLADWLARDQRERLDEDGKEQLDLLLGRVKRMNQLIDGILRYSRIGRAKEAAATLDLAQVTADVIDLLAPPAHVRVVVDGPMPTLRGSRTQLTQLFQNLIGNAVKFCDKAEGAVSVSCVEEGGMHRFEIRDNGPGIDERHHQRIFQIFQTLTPRDKTESTGIGLSIVKKIVESTGGRVWLESTPGSGSRFFFTIPKTTETS
jgi:PAS domain S-box-containing protein